MDRFMLWATIIGFLTGEAARRFSCILIRRRSEGDIKNVFLTGKWSALLWMGLGALGSAAICMLTSGTMERIEYIVAYFVLMCLSAVDITIRKIPNPLLLMLFAIKLAALIIKADFSHALASLAGFAAGWFLFTVPAFIGIGIGWGDVKLAAAAGFCLGLTGLFQAVIIMALITGIFALYLYASKKGNLKTSIAMGPPLAMGVLLTLLFPVASAI